MAKLTISKIKALGNATHVSTTWQVAKDVNFLDIVDESIEDTENLLEWITPLPKGDGTFYKDLSMLYARVKIHYVTNGVTKESNYFMLNSCNQLEQKEKEIIYA